MSTAKDLREKSAEELTAAELEARKALMDARYQHSQRQLTDTASLRRQRREVARLLTLKTEKARAKAGTEKK